MGRDTIVLTAYFVSSVLFILGVKSLTHPDTARRGMQMAALGMLVAIVGTLFLHEIVTFRWIIIGLIVGSIIGYPLGMWVPMTAMPERIAISHTFGSLAASLVGIAEYYNAYQLAGGNGVGHAEMAALGLEVLFGSLTVTGSFMACGKLQGFVTERSVIYPFQNQSNIGMFAIAVLMFLYLIIMPGAQLVFYAMLALATLLGVLMVLPIGGADMPVLLSLFNAYTGLAAAATGFALNNYVLIITGALDGASGFILSVAMSKAMNRSFTSVLFGAFGSGTGAAGAARSAEGLTVNPITVEDAAMQLAYARSVVIVPGYGMAVAQCQHQVRELSDLIERRGGEVKFAIHPVAGRMPGHMNVLLAEVDIPYARLYGMEDINPDFNQADVALVIGANDVVNPAAKDEPGSPIYGMPILNVDEARSVIVLKRSMNPGFAGIENDLFYRDRTFMLFGDAKDSLGKLIAEMKNV
ncbi:MAG TPA: NAD(P)(+) transhydrogenase (Re/Si-specific) subunit beta [Candidatus Binataceae bacterium]|nr:NAD(P)(+) transhydrogenase (Re/Si-specific) subunit beta [Candidatus Binataceae bacterium]